MQLILEDLGSQRVLPVLAVEKSKCTAFLVTDDELQKILK